MVRLSLILLLSSVTICNAQVKKELSNIKNPQATTKGMVFIKGGEFLTGEIGRAHV